MEPRPGFAPLNPDGSADADALLELVDDKTSLVSVIHVNNETGAINDINTIAERVKGQKSARPLSLRRRAGVRQAAVQAWQEYRHVFCQRAQDRRIKGHGCAHKAEKTRVAALYLGRRPGGRAAQRHGERVGIAAFRAAARTRYLGGGIEKNYSVVRNVQSRLWELLDKQLFERISPEYGSPYILTVAARGVAGKPSCTCATTGGLIIGTGSACSSNAAKKYSRVMQGVRVGARTD